MPSPKPVEIDTGEVVLGARYWPGGGRRPVLCVHGLASNARLWDEVADLLEARGHPVMAVDLRGHGASAAAADFGADPTLTAAADLAAVCVAVGWDRPVVVGQSWGGNVALQLAADAPDLVHGLALVDGGWLHLGDRWRSVEDAWVELAPPVLVGRPAEVLRTDLAGAHPGWSAPAVSATMASLEQLADGTVRPWLSREWHKAIVASLISHRPRELYPRVRCRCALLAVTPPGDTSNPLAEEALAALPPGSTLRRFPGADHDLHAQHPNHVAAAIGSLA